MTNTDSLLDRMADALKDNVRAFDKLNSYGTVLDGVFDAWIESHNALLTEYDSFIQSQAKEKGEPKIGFFAMTEEGFKQPQPKDVQQDTQVKPEEPATGGVKTAEDFFCLDHGLPECGEQCTACKWFEKQCNRIRAAQFQSPQPSAVWVKASTPPKDGSWILAWVEMGIRILYFENGTFRWNDNGDEVRHFTVTHWTPLPQPPTSI